MRTRISCPRHRFLSTVVGIPRIRSGAPAPGSAPGDLRIFEMSCRGWTRRRLCRLCWCWCWWDPLCLGPWLLFSMEWAGRDRGFHSLRRGGRWGRVLVGRIGRAMASWGWGWVEGRRCGLFGRRLWGDLMRVAGVIWRLGRRKGRCLSWSERRMDWRAEN